MKSKRVKLVSFESREGLTEFTFKTKNEKNQDENEVRVLNFDRGGIYTSVDSIIQLDVLLEAVAFVKSWKY